MNRTAVASSLPRPNSARYTPAAMPIGMPIRLASEQNDARADDGVGHAATGLADRRGNVGEEGKVERACALVDQVKEDGNQRGHHEDGGQDGETADEVVRGRAARIVQPHGLRLEVHRAGWMLNRLSAHISAPSPARRA